MPPQTFDVLSRSIKRGEIAPAYYLHGSEDVLKETAIRAIIDRVLDPGLRDFNFDQRSAAQADGEEIYALCRTPAMMAERRVVVLRDVEAWKRKTKARAIALDYLARPSAGTVLLLVQGAAEPEDRDLARLALSIACNPLTPDRTLRWVQYRASEVGVAIQPDAAELLVQAVGADLGALAAEIEKLAAVSDGIPVTAEQVAMLVGVRHGETVHDWRDAVFDGEAGRAARLLEPVLSQAGVTGVKLLTLLGTTLVGVAAARDAYDRNLRGPRLQDAMFQLLRRCRTYGLLRYGEEARRWARWAPAWTPARIRAALRDALAADTALKNTTITDERGVLLDLVLRLAAPAKDAA